MINRIKALFAEPEGASVETHSVDEIHLAAAALLVEAARLDESYDEVEREAILNAVKHEFELTDEECETLIQQAEAAQHEATDLHRFIQKFDANFGHAERLRLIEMLWQVVYADGEADHRGHDDGELVQLPDHADDRDDPDCR